MDSINDTWLLLKLPLGAESPTLIKKIHMGNRHAPLGAEAILFKISKIHVPSQVVVIPSAIIPTIVNWSHLTGTA